VNAEAFRWCAAEVRHNDYDRYLSTLFAPNPARAHLLALYAFNHEVAKSAEVVREPAAGLIRLQWWRETLEAIYAGEVRQHEVVLALAETIRARNLPRELFDRLIEAREADVESEPFAAPAAMESYADATSGNLMRLAVRVMGANASADEQAGQAGAAYALTGLLRAMPYRAACKRLALPADLLALNTLNPDEIFSGRNSAQLRAVVRAVASAARSHLKKLRVLPVPGDALPAILPAALCPIYLEIMTREEFDPFRDSTDVSRVRRQWAMLRASLRGRV